MQPQEQEPVGNFFGNIPFVRKMKGEWLYCSAASKKLSALLANSRALARWRVVIRT